MIKNNTPSTCEKEKRENSRIQLCTDQKRRWENNHEQIAREIKKKLTSMKTVRMKLHFPNIFLISFRLAVALLFAAVDSRNLAAPFLH